MTIFDDLSSSWWDPHGPMKVLHQINPLRLDLIRSFANLQGSCLLDVGCGAGLLSESLSRCGARVSALDQSQKLIDVARLHAAEQSLDIDYRCASLFALPDSEQFDYVVCFEVLEHIEESLDEFLAHCVHVLKPGGVLFLSTINRTLRSYVLAILMAEYVLGLLPRGTHDWKAFIRPSELLDLVKPFNLSLLHMAGLSYNIFMRSASLVSSVDVNYFMVFQK